MLFVFKDLFISCMHAALSACRPRLFMSHNDIQDAPDNDLYDSASYTSVEIIFLFILFPLNL